MKVLYDHQAFCMQDTGGISRYYHELMQHFHNHPLIRFELAIKYSSNTYLREAMYARPHHQWLPDTTFRGKKHILDILNRPLSKKRIARRDFDLFHPTYYHPYFLNVIGNRPFVLTIHDMIHELFPSEFKPDKKVILNKMLLAQKASLIITISEQSKKDIMRFYNTPGRTHTGNLSWLFI
ncbi:MAG: hypothetical protein KatS3mg031_0900 [Chitinophagales bacterium]|nr:MAG: hypothetical protein KatS3mg031_0900 [Chitinophagales bacterium]